MRKVLLFRIAGIILVLALGVLAFYFFGKNSSERSAVLIGTDNGSETDQTQSRTAESAERAFVYVYLTGAVKEPGVYVLPEGSRLYQAIQRAGGLDTGADLSQINEAVFLSDGEHIHVPYIGETVRSSFDGPDSITVNINTDDAERLMLLPGIGEAKAKAIIRYRTQAGPFSSVEDIMNVSGIGKALFEQIKDRIRV